MPATPVGDQPQAATNTLNAAAAHLAHNNGLKVPRNNVLKNQTGYNSPLFDGKDSQMEKGESSPKPKAEDETELSKTVLFLFLV